MVDNKTSKDKEEKLTNEANNKIDINNNSQNNNKLNEEIMSNSTSISSSHNNPRKKIPVVAIIVIILVLIGGYFVFGRKGKEEKEEKTDIITEAPTSTPTQAPEVERSDIKIQVLNGSGKEGAAGDFASILEDLGYEDPETDNADNYDYEDITIQVKDTDEGEAIYDLLKEDLEDEDYIVNDLETLDEDSEFDVVIIVGLKEGEEEVLGEETEEPTPAGTEEETEEATPTPEEPTPEATESGETE